MVMTKAKNRIFTPKMEVIMKRLCIALLVFMGLMQVSFAQEHQRYALKWHDEFDSGALDPTVWSKPWRTHSDWAMHQSGNEALYDFEDGDLVLWGKVNDFDAKDTASVLTGGVWTRNRKAFGYGRVEVRAKFDVAQGFWPAIWMLPQSNNYINWPHGGEIDIMEHFGYSNYIDQTVHTNYTYHLKKRIPPHTGSSLYREGDYNIYTVERFPDSVVFSVNGQRTFCYPRYRKGVDGQFPFSNYDFYLILDAQLGGSPCPIIDKTKLPVALRIDYVRYYELDTKTDVIPEPKDFQQLKSKKRQLRKVVYDKKTHYENPDEYHLVVKCGKATISGNRKWAESTLKQLTDENLQIANLEVHDYAACPYRGVTLDAKKCRLSAERMTTLLDMMALYKLNYLQWDGAGDCTAEEIDMLREHARDCGITLVEDISSIPDVSLINVRNNGQVSAMNQVFMKKAVGNGAFLYLDSFEADDMVTLMAFAERYWRGGDAGAVEDDVVSPAASSWANFKEKVKIHCSD